MSSYIPIVYEVLSGCISAVVSLFDSLGATGYLTAVMAFVMCCRYMILPFLDSGGAFLSTPDISARFVGSDGSGVARGEVK